MKRSYSLFISIVCGITLSTLQQCNAAILVQGNDTQAPFGFNAPISAFAFDQLSGGIYVALNSSTATVNEYALSYAILPSFTAAPQFTGIATDTEVKDQSINLLAVSSGNNQSPIALVVRSNNDTNLVGVSNELLSTTTIDTILDTTTITQTNLTAESADLNDASGTNVSSSIIALASSNDYAFAAVTGTDEFGVADSNSGIALVTIKRGNHTLELVPLNAQTGTAGNAASLLDATSIALNGGTAPVTFATGVDANQVTLFYDNVLNLLYAGVRIETADSVGSIGKAVVIGEVTSPTADATALELVEIVPNSALNGDNNTIVAALVDTLNTPASLAIKNLSVLHASTGPDYLIVNGGNGTSDTVGNKIYALPLVNNPGTITHGTLADKLSPLDPEFHVFTVPATTSGDLVEDNDPEALVGAGDLPIQADQSISHIMVAGDSVYVSSSVSNDTFNSAGLFYSSAQFDKNGKILSWTPWKRALPSDPFPNTTLANLGGHDGKINQFAIDARTGSTWFVEGTNSKNVGIATWTQSNGTNGLVTQLNMLLPYGSYTMLDLDQSTRGFVQKPLNPDYAGYRYALFGSADKIVFTLISQSQQTDLINGTETNTTDFSLPQNILVTQLPEGAGCLQSLEYARQTAQEGNTNYFFAGTTNGLYVFTNQAQQGFSVNDLGTLDQPLFTTRSWHKVSTITGSVIALKTNGTNLYIMTQESTKEKPFNATILSIPYLSTASAMFALSNINTIAQTGEGIFENVLQFFDMALVNTNTVDNMGEEQLVLATNNGLFFSDEVTGINTSTNQTDAAWTLLEGTEQTLFNGIGQTNIQPQHTVWPFSMQDLAGKKTFTRSSIHQLSGNDSLTPAFTAFMPTSFNVQDNSLATFAHIYGFWSDGARRYFITQPLQDNQNVMNLAMLPFNTQGWNANSLLNLSYGPLSNIKNFYWVQNIGSSGMILAGTNTGVVALA